MREPKGFGHNPNIDSKNLLPLPSWSGEFNSYKRYAKSYMEVPFVLSDSTQKERPTISFPVYVLVSIYFLYNKV